MDKLLIANRGEITCRIARTAKKMGIPTLSIYSTADRNAMHRYATDEAVCIGESESTSSYLDMNKIIEIAKTHKCTMIHPGYGFLSENALFAKKVSAKKIIFIGPHHKTIAKSGSKVTAKEIAQKAGVPVLQPLINGNAKATKDYVQKHGFPLVVKAAGGGGGRGMRIVHKEKDLKEALESASREAKSFFDDPQVFIEPYITHARHVEVQIVADSFKNVATLGTRDCTLQRNHQKVIEEAPAIKLKKETIQRLQDAAKKIALETDYSNAGTVEFLVDQNENFYFMEVNCRLQVEHTVTEEIFEIDLVELQLRVAQGKKLTKILPKQKEQDLHSIQLRICAEIPEKNFTASTGRIIEMDFPQASFIRVDSGFRAGSTITHYYDSMIAKLIVNGSSRLNAIHNTIWALQNSHIAGVKTNMNYLLKLLKSDQYLGFSHHTKTAEEDVFTEQTPLSITEKEYIVSLGLLAILLKTQAQQRTDLIGFRAYGHNKAAHSLRFLDEIFELESTTQESTTTITFQNTSKNSYFFSNSLQTKSTIETTINQESISYKASIDTDNSLWLTTLGKNYHLKKVLAKELNTDNNKATETKITSPLPGKIIAISVKKGAKALKDQNLIILESMKMEHIITASSECVVDKILVKVGDVVQAEDVLIELS